MKKYFLFLTLICLFFMWGTACSNKNDNYITQDEKNNDNASQSVDVPADMQCQHSWQEATCTTPKTCSLCGVTEGEASGHSWTEANCTAPKTCSLCGLTEGAAKGHNWTAANCTTPKTCSVCGVTEGEASGHNWTEANCTAPKTCSLCGITEGEAAGHKWTEATCIKPKTCSVCGTTDGAAPGHKWKKATCTKPKTCSVCGAAEGEKLGHSWQAATCAAPKTCSICKKTDGAPLAHSWQAATGTAPKTCKLCGKTEGEPLDIKEVTDYEITIEFPFGKRTGTYSGTLINNIPEGNGKFNTHNEAAVSWYYEGEWKNGLFNGQGKTVFESGGIKEGIHVNGIWKPTNSQLLTSIYDTLNKEFNLNAKSVTTLNNNPKYFFADSFNDISAVIDYDLTYEKFKENPSLYGDKLMVMKECNIYDFYNVNSPEGYKYSGFGITIDNKFYDVICLNKENELTENQYLSCIYGLPMTICNPGGNEFIIIAASWIVK